jgi:hypothetical protein
MPEVTMRKLTIAVVLALLMLFSVCVLAACEDLGNDTVTHVTAVQIQDTSIYMAPYGEPSVYTLQPWVMPSDASNKGLTYRLLDVADNQYLTVNGSGKITAKKEKENGVVVIRIASMDNPDAYLDVNVTIEIVSVRKITFVPSEQSILLGSAPIKITPVFTPYHAVLGRNVTYESLEPSVARVEDGIVEPVSVGITTIKATASNDENINAEDLVKGYLILHVKYTPPNYKLNIADPAESCKQILNETTPILLNLDKMDKTSDPKPLIRWRVAGAPIAGTEDKEGISYNPSDLPIGSYSVEVTITDASSQTQVLYSDPFSIYEKLTNLDIAIYNSAEELERLSENDTLRMGVSFNENEYPPDEYKWTIYKDGAKYGNVVVTRSKTFNYKLTSVGLYSFTCEAIIKNKNSGIIRSTAEFGSSQAREGNDIYNLHVTARKFGAEIVPYVTWDVLYYNTGYQVSITTSDGPQTLSSTVNGEYFTANGMYVPPQIASLTDAFSVAVRSDFYGWTDEYHYDGSLSFTNADKVYFDTLTNDFDSYIDSVEEMGRLFNYIYLFRPASLYNNVSGSFGMTLKFGILYSDVSPAVYPLPSGYTGNPSQEFQDALNIVVAATNCYCETVSYTPSIISYNADTRVLDFTITFSSEDSEMTATLPGNNPYVNAEVTLHYASVPRAPGSALPIDSNTRTMSVSTSNQLYFAVVLGYRPVPVSGSPAETIYNAAKAVSRRIINNSMSDAAKVHAIYDYLTAEMIYDNWLTEQDFTSNPEKVYESFNLEGVFLRGVAVCDGIAKAFTLLCGIEGIASVKINGETGTTGHAWNKVLIDGKWYACDATWGSSRSGYIEYQNHDFLLTTDAYLVSRNHHAYGKQHATESTPYPIN